jgi:hypothetical protein
MERAFDFFKLVNCTNTLNSLVAKEYSTNSLKLDGIHNKQQRWNVLYTIGNSPMSSHGLWLTLVGDMALAFQIFIFFFHLLRHPLVPKHSLWVHRMNKTSIWQPHADFKTQFTNSDGPKIVFWFFLLHLLRHPSVPKHCLQVCRICRRSIS